jgi:hypothetical protein
MATTIFANLRVVKPEAWSAMTTELPPVTGSRRAFVVGPPAEFTILPSLMQPDISLSPNWCRRWMNLG